MRRYREPDADNARWDDFEFRPGDIIVDAPSKSGTTWTQLLVALLVFDGHDFPEPVGRMSLWMEQATRPVDEAHAVFAAQTHRRFIKSHTPLDGLPTVDDVKYVCVGRDPRDAAISMIHHSANLDRRRFAELTGQEEVTPEERSTAEHLDRFIDGDDFPGWNARFLAHHYTTFWERRHDENVALFHFADYTADLPGELQRLADHLQIPITRTRAEALAAEADIERVRSRAAQVAPEAHMELWKDTASFFRSGASGEGAEHMSPGQHERYETLIGDLVPNDLAGWIHDGSR